MIGLEQEPTYPGNTSQLSVVGYVVLIGGCVVASSLVVFVSYLVHSRWWYFEYLIARRRTQKVVQLLVYRLGRCRYSPCLLLLLSFFHSFSLFFYILVSSPLSADSSLSLFLSVYLTLALSLSPI